MNECVNNLASLAVSLYRSAADKGLGKGCVRKVGIRECPVDYTGPHDWASLTSNVSQFCLLLYPLTKRIDQAVTQPKMTIEKGTS